jgi:beta-galactosidase/beta-glucuronidase
MRDETLVSSAVVLLALLVGCKSLTLEQARNSKPLPTGRQSPADTIINEGWKFMRGDVPGAAGVAFDDASWQEVRLPHTWNNLDGQDGGNDYYRGPAWYRKHINTVGGRSSFLRFDGVSIAAEVFVNGKRVGSHHNAFGAFCFDITDAVRPGDNLIAVRADNTRFDDAPRSPATSPCSAGSIVPSTC